MRRKNHLCLLPRILRKPLQPRPYPCHLRLNQPGLIAPRIDIGKINLTPHLFLRILHLLLIKANTHPRIMRRHHNTHSLLNAILLHLRHRLFNPRLPMTHPRICLHIPSALLQHRLNTSSLLKRAIIQRRSATNLRVATAKLRHKFWRHRPPTPNIAQISRHIIQRIGAAISHQKHAYYFFIAPYIHAQNQPISAHSPQVCAVKSHAPD